jgi:hypothetical protein
MLGLLLALSFSETHPPFTWQTCTKAGCSPSTTSLVADADYRGTPTGDIDYSGALGVTTTGGTLVQRLVTISGGNKNVGSRLYLLDATGTKYQLFKLIGKELSYDVNLAQIPCGVNAAVYTIEMPASGEGAGAAYGTGYCDGNYVKSKGSTKAGCAEFDIQEANNQAMVFTTHPCATLGQFSVPGQCSTDGCGFNAYRYGGKTFWGQTVNPKQKMTIVTQFVGTGTLTEIRRLYIQGGVKIPNPKLLVYNTAQYDSITDAFCRTAGHSVDGWHSIAQMGRSFANGHVLCFSLWDSNDMGWLDAGEYGPCVGSQSKEVIEAQNPGMTVTYSNLKFGDIDTTY